MNKLLFVFCIAWTSVAHADYAVFGFPGGKEIETEIFDLIESMHRGGEIKLASYYITNVSDDKGRYLSDVLLCAAKRGIKVTVLTDFKLLIKEDSSIDRDNNARYFVNNFLDDEKKIKCNKKLSNRTSKNYITPAIEFCFYGCAWGKESSHPKEAIQHNKFILLKDNNKSFVLQGSSNFSRSQQKMFQDMLVIKDNQEVYDTYSEYLDWLLDVRALHVKNTVQKIHTNKYALHHFPIEKCSKSKTTSKCIIDPVIDFLKKINTNKRCEIYINMYIWSSSRRSKNIAKLITNLSNNLCKVEIILNKKHLRSSILRILKKSKNTKILLRKAIHSKYILVNAFDHNNKPFKSVWAGSHNFTKVSLRRNDETAVIINDNAIFDSYLRNWKEISRLRK